MATNFDRLSGQSCIVNLECQKPKSESSSCGTVLYPSQGLVISHGSILTELVTNNKKLLAKVENGILIQNSDLHGAAFSLLFSNETLSPKLTKDRHINSLNIADSVSSTKLNDRKNLSHDLTSVNCRFLGAFRNNDFHKTLNEMMPRSSWSYNNTDISTDNKVLEKKRDKDESYVSSQLLSYFLLFKFIINDRQDPYHLPESFISEALITRNKCCIGNIAEIVATPFANMCPSVFYNTYSRGVVSNINGHNNCWIVTDARCIPGSEGGPLFTKRKASEIESYLTGIIASSMCWKNNEWIGFSVACGIDSILESMATVKDLQKDDRAFVSSSKLNRIKVKADPSFASAITVLIQCGSTWGTGVIIDGHQGLILTCSHVLKDADSYGVTATMSKNKRKDPVEIIYRQVPVQAPYDIAVVKCPQATQHLPTNWSIQVAPAVVGDEVILSGHAVFNTDHDLSPSVCCGVVSKVIKRKKKPVLFQTTCAVHAGTSGGPLLKPDGSLIGIVVCNTRDVGNDSSFPHVNLCIPATAVWPAVKNYLLTGDKDSLSQLQVDDTELKQLWALGTSTSTSQGIDAMQLKSRL